jgi:hypothetical protein
MQTSPHERTTRPRARGTATTSAILFLGTILLLFDLVLKRTIQDPTTGKRLPPGVFSKNILLASRHPGFSDGPPPGAMLMSPTRKKGIR